MKEIYKKYNALFHPIDIRGIQINNRNVMIAMRTNFGETNGEMSFLHMDYYEQRARDSVGLIIVENTCVKYPEDSNGKTKIPLIMIIIFRVFINFMKMCINIGSRLRFN